MFYTRWYSNDEHGETRDVGGTLAPVKKGKKGSMNEEGTMRRNNEDT